MILKSFDMLIKYFEHFYMVLRCNQFQGGFGKQVDLTKWLRYQERVCNQQGYWKIDEMCQLWPYLVWSGCGNRVNCRKNYHQKETCL